MRAPFTAAFILLALVISASFLPEERMWGINHLAYYSMPMRLTMLAVIALFFFPTISRFAYRRFASGAKLLSEHSLKAGIFRIIIPVLAFILFLNFKSSTLLLGDGRYIANNMQTALERDALTVPQFFKTATMKEPIYPGTELLYFIAAKIGGKISGTKPLTSIRILNALLGLLFVILLLHFVHRSHASPEIRAMLFLLVTFSGGVELFFGYIESYAPLALIGALYILTAWRALGGSGSLWLPLLCIVTGCVLHIQCLLLLPSCILLISSRITGDYKNRFFGWIVWITVLIIVIGIFFSSRTQTLGRFFLPFHSTDETYGVFSLTHIIDILNELLLIFPAWLFLIFIALKRRGDSGNDNVAKDAFAWLLFIPSILFLFLFNPKLGMARDWDLFSLVVFGLFPIAYTILKRFYSQPGVTAVLSVTAPPVVVISAVLTIAWVGINANESKSVVRFENILEYDRTNAGYAYENLSLYFKEQKNQGRAIEALENAYAASGNPRYLSNLGILYIQRGDTLKAGETYRECLRKAPQNETARSNYIRLLVTMKKMDELIEVCRQGSELNPDNPYYSFCIGQAYFWKGRVDEGLAAFEDCKRLNPPPAMVEEIDELIRIAPSFRKLPEQP